MSQTSSQKADEFFSDFFGPNAQMPNKAEQPYQVAPELILHTEAALPPMQQDANVDFGNYYALIIGNNDYQTSPN